MRALPTSFLKLVVRSIAFTLALVVEISFLFPSAAAAQELRDLLSAYRVVTLMGPGGIGKTALMLDVARSLLPTFPGDAWLVELATLVEPGLVPSAVAAALGLKVVGDEISSESVDSRQPPFKSPLPLMTFLKVLL